MSSAPELAMLEAARTGFSVALIGPDGSGKTTIARRLEQAFPRRLKYLYMGINPDSSNVMLPTTRMVKTIKGHLASRNRTELPTSASAGEGRPNHRGALWSMLRLVNRVAEEIFRLALTWMYKKRGSIVVQDRCYKFDFACNPETIAALPMAERLHRVWLQRLYPSPDLVIFLEAPPELLLSRKREGTVEWLRERQQAILREGQAMHNFLRVDATRPLEDVYSEVAHHIIRFTR